MEEKTKKGLALGMTGLVGLAAGAGLVAYTGEDVESQVEDQLVTLLEQYEAELKEAYLLEKQDLIDEYELKVAELKDALDNVEPEVVVKTEEVIVEVDNGNLAMVLEYMLDGDVLLVTDGLDDDELDLIVDRIVFINEAESLASNFVKNNFAKLAEDEEGYKITGKLVEDADLVTDIYVLNVELIAPNFSKYEEFGYKSVEAKVKIAVRYDGGAFGEKEVLVEIWNDKVRLINLS